MGTCAATRGRVRHAGAWPACVPRASRLPATMQLPVAWSRWLQVPQGLDRTLSPRAPRPQSSQIRKQAALAGGVAARQHLHFPVAAETQALSAIHLLHWGWTRAPRRERTRRRFAARTCPPGLPRSRLTLSAPQHVLTLPQSSCALGPASTLGPLPHAAVLACLLNCRQLLDACRATTLPDPLAHLIWPQSSVTSRVVGDSLLEVLATLSSLVRLGIVPPCHNAARQSEEDRAQFGSPKLGFQHSLAGYSRRTCLAHQTRP